MNLLNTRMVWKAMLVIFPVILTPACQPVTAVPSVIPSVIPSATSPFSIFSNCPVGEHTEKLVSGGQTREYLLHVPSTYQPEKSMALVLGFHGAGSNASQFESYSGFSTLADREGLIVVYPQAAGEHSIWNVSPSVSNLDKQFIRDLIATLAGYCNIDPNRIYARGHSNGGGMANRLACDITDQITAIGSVSGAYQWSEDCSPTRPIAILAMHGTDDPIIPYNGFPNTGRPPASYYLIGNPIPQWAYAWAARNGCEKQPSMLALNEQTTEQKWSNCRAEADVILYTIQGGGHGWPDAFDATQLIWNFFVQHPLKDD